MKNWKTTLFGTLAAIATSLSAVFPDYKELLLSAAGLFGAIGLIFAKDGNVTGGTVKQ